MFKRKLELYDENPHFIKITHVIRLISYPDHLGVIIYQLSDLVLGKLSLWRSNIKLQ